MGVWSNSQTQHEIVALFQECIVFCGELVILDSSPPSQSPASLLVGPSFVDLPSIDKRAGEVHQIIHVAVYTSM